MKSIKYFMFGFITCFILIFIIGVIINSFNSSVKVYIKTIDNFDDNISSLRSRLSKIENATCSTSLSSLIDRSEKTYYKNNISLKKYINNYYSDNTDFYKMYLETLDSCSINIDDVNDITKLVIASKSFPESLKAKFNTSYEIKFIDFINYKNIYELSDNLGSYSSKELELMTIDKLITLNTKSIKKSK